MVRTALLAGLVSPSDAAASLEAWQPPNPFQASPPSPVHSFKTAWPQTRPLPHFRKKAAACLGLPCIGTSHLAADWPASTPEGLPPKTDLQFDLLLAERFTWVPLCRV